LLKPGGHGDAVRGVQFVVVFSIGIARERLGVALIVGGADFDFILAGAWDIPGMAPGSPNRGNWGWSEFGGLPRAVRVETQFNLRDVGLSGPGYAFDLIGLCANFLGVNGAEEFGIHAHASDDLAIAIGFHCDVVLLLEIAFEGLLRYFDAGQPFHGIHAIPA